ncbi:RNA-directed DNA polymerase from mobile element jockey [Trichonephila clavipes]|nr:RNA-directed DNA polymerase from mobile element jockey [Trichonephila clavipes]
MSKISPFAVHKTLIGIGGEPKSVKRLQSGDLLKETTSALQTKSFLLAKSFLNNPVTLSPHKTLNSCRGVISEPDLLGTPDSEILEGFSDQGVNQENEEKMTSHLHDSKARLSTVYRISTERGEKRVSLITRIKRIIFLSPLHDTSKITACGY